MEIKVYITSKLRHAEKLSQLRLDGIHINSRWIDTVRMPNARKKPVTHWQQENFDDIAASHFVILYLEAGDELEGQLWEAGYACGLGRKIWVAGDGHGVEVDIPDQPGATMRLPHRGILPWALYRPQVRVVLSLETAFTMIKREALPRTTLKADGTPFTERVEDVFTPR